MADDSGTYAYNDGFYIGRRVERRHAGRARYRPRLKSLWPTPVPVGANLPSQGGEFRP
jgi:hypothetical protein